MGLSSTAKSFINNICNSHRDPGTTWIQTMTFSGFVVELLLVTMSPKNSCSSSNIRFFYWNFLVCYEQALCTPFYVLSQDVVKSFLKVIGCIRKAKRSPFESEISAINCKILILAVGFHADNFVSARFQISRVWYLACGACRDWFARSHLFCPQPKCDYCTSLLTKPRTLIVYGYSLA